MEWSTPLSFLIFLSFFDMQHIVYSCTIYRFFLVILRYS